MRILSVLGALAASTASALGADAVFEQDAAPSVSLPALYTWTGPYAGGFVGYNFSNFDQSGGADFDGEGFVGGVYAGYNLQTDQLVYGLEADIGGSDVDAGGFNNAAGLPVGSDGNAFGSLRARLGWAYDSILLFATGGLAVSGNELSLAGADDQNTHFGYTVGAGVEAAVTDNLSSRLEYRYSDFESKDYNLGNVTISSGFDEHSIRAGLALKF
ncbi:outer membrane protein [Aureimonas populi]|uniref:outer membrane protein n=1 Tax=Aureimonas populi TaxID=1701758 RepID=UPI001FD796A2|nr:outer membrane protein [Aureimonas populi]